MYSAICPIYSRQNLYSPVIEVTDLEHIRVLIYSICQTVLLVGSVSLEFSNKSDDEKNMHMLQTQAIDLSQTPLSCRYLNAIYFLLKGLIVLSCFWIR